MRRFFYGLTGVCLFLTFSAFSQESHEFSGEIKTRYMRTENRDSLADFSILVSFAKLNYSYQLSSWLKIGAQANVLLNYGTDGVTKRDPFSNSGPIYEGNLWNARLMDGSTEFTLPQVYADLTFGDHTFTLGRFLRNTPAINAEPWPLPNALEGFWYQFENEKKLKLQAALITQISPRMSGRFRPIGTSIGKAGVGRGVDGNPSGYRNNTESDFIVMLNANFGLSEKVRMNIWNYYVDNVTTTLLLEPSADLGNGWSAEGRFIYQSIVGDGGNADAALAYTVDEKSTYFGLRVEKKTGAHEFQLNFSRIGDQGRLLFPREWGLEPFYTFQRRTRVEGLRDVTALMFRWQRVWENEKQKLRLYSSVGQHWTPDVTDAPRNKLQLPSHLHVDVSAKYEPFSFLNNFSAEVYTAYRFLAEEIGQENALVNRADFWHFDLILSWVF